MQVRYSYCSCTLRNASASRLFHSLGGRPCNVPMRVLAPTNSVRNVTGARAGGDPGAAAAASRGEAAAGTAVRSQGGRHAACAEAAAAKRHAPPQHWLPHNTRRHHSSASASRPCGQGEQQDLTVYTASALATVQMILGLSGQHALHPQHTTRPATAGASHFRQQNLGSARSIRSRCCPHPLEEPPLQPELGPLCAYCEHVRLPAA
eukprot:scaffold605_cov400-Prasinococcus_capsulatus_cf.AAC.15